MLDELLGRAELHEEIASLEAEIEQLEGRLAGESDRRQAAVRSRQEAEERVNRLEDRIADLEGQLEQGRGAELGREFRGRESLRGDRLRTVLSRLASVEAGAEGAFTAMVTDEPDDATSAAFGERTPLLARAAPCLAMTDDAGLVSAAIRPPFPPAPFTTWQDRFRVDRAWFLPPDSFAIALVRSDLFAYGEFEGDACVYDDGFESAVKGAHSKGGFSQGRFERRRDEQIEAHLDRCRAVLVDRSPDRLLLAGQGSLFDAFGVDSIARVPVDATGEPAEALTAARRAVFTADLFLL